MKNVNLLSPCVFHFSEAYDKVQAKPTEVFVLQQDASNDNSPTPPPETMPPPQLPSHAKKPRKTKGYKISTSRETSLFIFHWIL
jgi:hypothetical protein